MGPGSAADRPGAESDRQGDSPIRFGTSGWRGIFGQDFSFEKLRIALHAVGRWVAERSPGGLVVVGHDTRAEGERMAELAAAVLRGHGLKPLLASGSVPTPVVAWAVRRRAAAAGVVFTASHNPPEYRGMKVLADSGGGGRRGAGAAHRGAGRGRGRRGRRGAGRRSA